MKKIFWIIPALLITCSLAAAAEMRNITALEAKSIQDKNRNVIFLDVRTPQEYGQGHIPGTLFIPIDEVERRNREIPRNKPVIVYCAVGSRSLPAARYLAKIGYGDVYNMSDGIVGWYRNKFQIVK